MAVPKNIAAAAAAAATAAAPLLSHTPMRRTWPYRIFAVIYASAILALFYHHAHRLVLTTASTAAAVAASLVLADAVLAFMWSTTQSFRMFPVRWKEHPENLDAVLAGDEGFPAVDVFVCTADPFKEPPVGVVNTVLSVMGYEYPAKKVSIYVSDDGGSAVTLFALMEAAKFGKEWVAFCRKKRVMERSPDAYFSSNPASCSEKIKIMYEKMKVRIENVVERGKVGDEYITGDIEREALNQWTDTFTKKNHPAVIQILADSSKDKDTEGDSLPNLIYVSREKNPIAHHHFKAGALNALLRVSAVISNAPIVLTLDSDTRSNDPSTLRRVLCHVFGPSPDRSKLSYIQFPQRFEGINKDDIYSGDYKSLYQLNPPGMKNGPAYVGTGCFFIRRSLFGSPSNLIQPEIPELGPEYAVRKSMQTLEMLELARCVAGCNYENGTYWGSEIGFRYGSLSEDFFTGLKLHSQGWKSRFCHPNRAAFLGDAPISLSDVLSQNKRWAIGLQQVAFSKYSPITFGVRSMGLLMGLSYCNNAFWPTLSIPMMVYAFVPQLALITGLSIFPKVSDPWFLLYVFLFIGAYAQDLVDFVLGGHQGTFRRWWNDQRMWLIRGLTSYPLGMIEYGLKSFGISSQHGFNVTNKIIDDEQSKKYEQGLFDFGGSSPMFVSLSTAATLNLLSLVHGLVRVAAAGRARREEGLVLQLLLASYGVVNSWPLYEAMLLRRDKGKLPTKVTLTSLFVASVLCVAASMAA